MYTKLAATVIDWLIFFLLTVCQSVSNYLIPRGEGIAYIVRLFARSAGAVEYTDCFSVEW